LDGEYANGVDTELVAPYIPDIFKLEVE